MEKSANIQYESIDLFKFIFAIVVIVIHTNPIMDFSETANYYFLNTFCDMAVPFFFVASGFFLECKIEENKYNASVYVKKYWKHILRMYLIWTIIWIPIKILQFYSNNFNKELITSYFVSVVLRSSGDALWYLLALIYAIPIIYCLSKRVNKKTLLIVAYFIYIIGVLLSSYGKLFENSLIFQLYYKVFSTTDNALFCGFIYIILGMYIKERQDIKDRAHGKKYLMLSVILFLLMIAEAVFINRLGLNINGVCTKLTMPFLIYCVFNAILGIKLYPSDKYRVMRDYSTLMYLVHCVIIRNVNIILGVFKVSLHKTVLFVLTFLLSMVFAVTVRYLSKDKEIKFLKMLY